MIEPLKTQRESNEGFVYDEPLTLERINAKLNEVIEAVNAQHHSIQTLNSISKRMENTANPLRGRP